METQDINGQLAQAIEKAAALLADSKAGKLAKAANISTSTGLYGYDLEAPAKLLMATLQGFFYRIPRIKATSVAREFKIITGVKLPGAKSAAQGARGNSATLTLAPYSFAPGTISSGVFQVTREAIAASGGFDPALNRATMLAMKLGLRNQAIMTLGGNPYLLGTPTVTVSENTTVKSTNVALSGSATYYVYVRAMTGPAFQDALISTPNGQALCDPTDKSFSAIGSNVSLLDGYGTPSTVQSVATPATDSSINVSWSPIPGAAAYGIFIGTTTGIANAAFVGCVGQCSVVVKDCGAAALTGTKASATQAYYDGDGAAQSKDTTADTTVDANAFPGILSQLYGVTTGGSIVASGAKLLNVNGKLSASAGDGIPEINEVLTQVYYSLLQNDDVTLLFSPADRGSVNRAYGAGASTSPLRINIPAGVGTLQKPNIFIDGYVHPLTGRAIPCETDPNIPQGTILVLPNVMPYPDTNIENPIAMAVVDEWINFEYAQAAPRRDYENRCYESVIVYVPPACGALFNVYRG
jgi:hypothetical protein